MQKLKNLMKMGAQTKKKNGHNYSASTMVNSPQHQAGSHKVYASTVVNSDNNSNLNKNGLIDDDLDDEELTALKLVCLSYIDMIEFVIDQIPEKKDNKPEPDFEPIFLQLKTFVINAKKQLGRNTKSSQTMNQKKITVRSEDLPDLPMEDPFTNTTDIDGSTDDIVSRQSNHHVTSLSSGSLLSDLNLDNLTNPSHKSTISSFNIFNRKGTGWNALDDDINKLNNNQQNVISKNEKKKIALDLKRKKNELKSRKFELLPHRIWEDYLLQYLCRTERFILSTTCKYNLEQCGLASYSFRDEFEFDNIYWRQNFFNYVDPNQDCTLLFDKNKWELLTNTQKRQLKYYIKYWYQFIIIKEFKIKQKIMQIEDNNNIMKDKDAAVDNNVDDDKNDDDMKSIIADNDDDDDDDDNKSVIVNNNDDDDDKKDIDDKDDEEEDLYAEEIEYSDDDRPRGLVLLDKYCYNNDNNDYFHNNYKLLISDASLHIAIPIDCEQLIISDCLNKRNGELSKWISSIICYMPVNCPIDYLSFPNNNFTDRDIHRICAGFIMRKEQSNLVGLNISNNNNITDRCVLVLLKTIRQKLNKLQFLILNNCTKLTNKTTQYLVEFYMKTWDNHKIQLNYIDLSNNYKIDDKGVDKLNNIYINANCSPTNVIVRINIAGTGWKTYSDKWSKNIILRPPKKRR